MVHLLSLGKIPCCPVQPELMALRSKGLQNCYASLSNHFSCTFEFFFIIIDSLRIQNISNEQMTNEVGRSLFAKAGELGAPVGIMVMKVKRSIPLLDA